MANDCVISKCVGRTNNNSLPKYGVIRLQSVASPSNGQFSATKATKPVTFKATANVFNSGQSSEIVATNVTGAGQNVAFVSSETPYRVEIKDKYTLIKLNVPRAFNTVFMSDFEYCNLLEKLSFDGSPEINIDSLGLMEALTDFTVSRAIVNGSIKTMVENFVHTYPLAVKNLKIVLYLCSGTGTTFNEQPYANSAAAKIAFNAGTAVVYADEAMTTELGSYNGTTWTYNS